MWILFTNAFNTATDTHMIKPDELVIIQQGLKEGDYTRMC
jgi:hypothetical protein